MLFAQRGTLKPDVKPQAPVNISDSKKNITSDADEKTWQVSDGLFVCGDSSNFCYEVKENGVSKMIKQKDVSGFFFEDGYKYIITVKEEMKKAPIAVDESIYAYTLIKVISKKPVENFASIPVASSGENKANDISKDAKNIPVVADQTTIVAPASPTNNNESKLLEEITTLKKQLKDLQKHVETMQLQLDMQLQLFNKK